MHARRQLQILLKRRRPVSYESPGITRPSLNIAFTGSIFTALPSTQSKPDGLFIHELAATTKIPERTPDMPTTIPDTQCTHLFKPVPAIQKNTQCNRLNKKCGALPRKRHADNCSRMSHKFRPEQVQFKGKNSTGNCAYSKKNSHSSGPGLCDVEINLLTGP